MTDLLNKYRPTKFQDVVGQDSVVKSIQSALKRKAGRVFLFTGPSGTGKTTLARIVANEVGCSPTDLQEIDAATFTGIDDMRSITTDMMYRPLSGPTRAIIIDECHALSKSAWQSLLKSLEKPPEYAYWFLCTTEANKVPATVKTRCLSYDLKSIPNKVLGELYDKVIEAEGFGTNEDVGDLIIKEAQGSARQLLANIAVAFSATTTKEAAELLQSAEGSPAAIELARALFKGTNWKEVQRILSGMSEVNAESVRRIIVAYGTKIALTSNEGVSGHALEVMSAFSDPFNNSTDISPLLIACGRLILLTEQ